MKILYCVHGTCNPGGMERMVVAKANAFCRRGHEVTIVTTDQAGRPDFFPLERGVRRLDSDVMYSQTIGLNPLSKYLARKRKMQAHRKFLQKVIALKRPDVVISTVGNEVGFLPDIAGGVATVAELHFSRFYRLQKKRRGIWRAIDSHLTRTDGRNLARYDRFVVLTASDAVHWKTHSNVVVIPNFVTIGVKEPAPLVAKRVIAVGRLEYQKNYPAMLEVWEQVQSSHPDWTLEIYGEGPDKTYLQEIINRKRLQDSVFLKGSMPPDGSAYSSASILLHTALYEGLPLSLIEAMSTGIPVVAFDCPCGPSEIISHGTTGFLIPPENGSSMVNALKKLMDDENLRRTMGDASFTLARRYDPQAIINRWESLFRELLATR